MERAKRPYSIQKRASAKKNRHIYYVQFKKSFLDRCLRDPAYLNSYVQKYAWYRDHGCLA